MTDAVATDDVRTRLREALETALSPGQLSLLLDEVLQIRKSARGWCPHCSKAVTVEIADSKAVAGALKDLTSEGYGSVPRAESGEANAVAWSASGRSDAWWSGWLDTCTDEQLDRMVGVTEEEMASVMPKLKSRFLEWRASWDKEFAQRLKTDPQFVPSTPYDDVLAATVDAKGSA